jgi:O-antigen ligase
VFIQGLVAVIVITTRPYRLTFIAGSVLVVAAILTGRTGPLARVLPFLPEKIFSEGGFTALAQELTSPRGSGFRRLNVIKDGLWMTSETHGVGVGAGNFEANIVKAPFPTEGVINPHNLWLEVLSQYGLLVFLLFVTWLIWCLLVGLRLLNHTEVTVGAAARPLGLTIVVSVLGNVLAATANSAYLESSVNWVFLGSLGVLTVTAERMLSDRARSSASGRAEDKLRRDDETPLLKPRDYDPPCPARHSLALDAGSMRS